MNEILRRIKRNPVMILSLLVAALSATQGLDWRQALIVVAGLVARQFTVPASEVEIPNPAIVPAAVPAGEEVI